MRAASREPRRLPEIREGQREIYQREGWATHGRSLGQEADRRGLWEEQLLLWNLSPGSTSFVHWKWVAFFWCLFLTWVLAQGYFDIMKWVLETAFWRNKITWLLLRYLVDIELCVCWSLVLAQLLNNSGHGSTHVLSRANDVYLPEFLWEMIKSKQSMTIIFLSYDCAIFWKDNCQDKKIRGTSRS